MTLIPSALADEVTMPPPVGAAAGSTEPAPAAASRPPDTIRLRAGGDLGAGVAGVPYESYVTGEVSFQVRVGAQLVHFFGLVFETGVDIIPASITVGDERGGVVIGRVSNGPVALFDLGSVVELGAGAFVEAYGSAGDFGVPRGGTVGGGLDARIGFTFARPKITEGQTLGAHVGASFHPSFVYGDNPSPGVEAIFVGHAFVGLDWLGP